MVNCNKTRQRARETATFRFTTDEKRMIAHLADVEGVTQTDLVRKLVADFARERGVLSVPVPPRRKRPGRPKKSSAEAASPKAPPARQDRSAPPVSQPGTFGALVARFRRVFSLRGDKMQAELEDTLRFVVDGKDVSVLFPLSLSLETVDGVYLSSVREKIGSASIRFPQKNLHLTYLRMVFNYAIKSGDISSSIDVAGALAPFTAKEIADAWPIPIGTG